MSSFLHVLRRSRLLIVVPLLLWSVEARSGRDEAPSGPPAGFRVVDAEGKDIGTFLSLVQGFELMAGNDRLGLWLHLSQSSGTLRTGGSFFWWEDRDCRGQGWGSGGFAKRVFGPLDDPDEFFFVSEDARERVIAFQSRGVFFNSFGGPFACENMTGDREALLSPLVPITSQDLGYSIPLPAPLRVERALPPGLSRGP
jgi:hypothetical protein